MTDRSLKIIFLDYDGVINRIDPPTYHTPTREIDGCLTMAEPELVYRLNLIVDRTGAEIVLSSSWRHQPDWREALKASGVVKPLLDRTPRRSDHKKFGIEYFELCRGHNIQDWLDEHPDVGRYAIIDDSSDMLASQLPNFFRTSTAEGLTLEIADAVEQHLSRPLTFRHHFVAPRPDDVPRCSKCDLLMLPVAGGWSEECPVPGDPVAECPHTDREPAPLEKYLDRCAACHTIFARPDPQA